MDGMGWDNEYTVVRMNRRMETPGESRRLAWAWELMSYEKRLVEYRYP
jgi:hypothetical protein